MTTGINRRFLLAAAVAAALALPLSGVWAQPTQPGDRPGLDAMLKAAKSKITEISLADSKALYDKGGFTFVDVRTGDEYKAGKIPGTKFIDRGLLEFNVERAIPDKATPLVVFCKTGGRAALAAYTLSQMGYTNVKSMAGGYDDWQKAGYPVEK
jgi:rhodanese-related sulfurtransferase